MLIPVFAVTVAVLVAVLARPAEATGPGPVLQLVRAYVSTARFQDVDEATQAGYAKFLDKDKIACIDLPGSGGMGTHYVSSGVGDTDLDPGKPEAVVYETQPDGSLRLVAVEYIVFQEAWDAAHNTAPSLFGQQFKLIKGDNRYGIPAFYELHAWIWKWNPRGLFDDWNSRVTCKYTS
jgi:hypothetical protein